MKNIIWKLSWLLSAFLVWWFESIQSLTEEAGGLVVAFRSVQFRLNWNHLRRTPESGVSPQEVRLLGLLYFRIPSDSTNVSWEVSLPWSTSKWLPSHPHAAFGGPFPLRLALALIPLFDSHPQISWSTPNISHLHSGKGYGREFAKWAPTPFLLEFWGTPPSAYKHVVWL